MNEADDIHMNKQDIKLKLLSHKAEHLYKDEADWSILQKCNNLQMLLSIRWDEYIAELSTNEAMFRSKIAQRKWLYSW